MNSSDWPRLLRACYDKALEEYGRGNRDVSSYFSSEALEFLRSIGCKPVELYDFAEDYPDIDWETALLITSARRDYYIFAEGAPRLEWTRNIEDFPAKDAELAGIPWLPRLIMKANAKLRGQLPDELMYCCGGDREFFKKYRIHPSDFLRFAWAAGDDHLRIVEFVTTFG